MEEKDVILDRTLFCFGVHFLQKNGGGGCHHGQDLVYLNSISYRRMEEEDVITDRTLFALCFISYKRMEEKDVLVDRPLFYGFLQKNGGHGVMLDRTFGKSTDGG